IEEVERLRTQFEILGFLDREFPRQGHIDIPCSGSPQAVAAGSAVFTSTVRDECSLVEPDIRRWIVHTRIPDLVRTLVALQIQSIVATADNGKRSAGMNSLNRGKLPPPGNSLHRPRAKLRTGKNTRKV